MPPLLENKIQDPITLRYTEMLPGDKNSSFEPTTAAHQSTTKSTKFDTTLTLSRNVFI